MSEVVVYAEWRLSEGEVTEVEQSLLADALADGDPCVWVEADRPGLLLASIDVEASDLSVALERGRELLVAAARTAGFTGTLTQLTAMDEERSARWP